MYSAWATPAYMTLHYPHHPRLAWCGFCRRVPRRQSALEGHLCRGGFPHSDICGSMLVCQLPAAFRRLPRPSSPVIAKASTTCTCSLDPITPKALAHLLRITGSILSACHLSRSPTLGFPLARARRDRRNHLPRLTTRPVPHQN